MAGQNRSGRTGNNSIRRSQGNRRDGYARSSSREGRGSSAAKGSSSRGRTASDAFRSSHGASGRMPVSRRKNAAQALHDGQKAIDWMIDIAKIVLIAVVILFSISISGQAYEIGYNIFYEEAVDEEGYGTEIEVTITEGMSVAQIGEMLEEAGLLLDGSVFQYQELFSSSHGQITAGTYTLSTEMTPSDIIVELASNYVEEDESSSETEEAAEDASEEEDTSEETEDAASEEEDTSAEDAASGELTDSEESAEE